MLPNTSDSRRFDRPWYEIDDFWGSNLWNIEPHCQVVGLGGEDTVILSGAFGGPICWRSFKPVNVLLRDTMTRWAAKVLLRVLLRLSPS